VGTYRHDVLPYAVRKKWKNEESLARFYTPQKVALMQQMAGAGCSAREIAEAIGSTPSSVRVVCSRQKIRLKAGRRMASGHVEQLAEHVGLVPEQAVIAYMPAPLYAEFNRKAADLNMPVSILACMLLNVIASSDLYKAVLDD
jgi:hypothetical protein